jgi:diadenosine tetraphosphate (Ap4A) HIT family hydrolase
MEWPEEFYELHRGVGCPMCAEGRPDATPHGIRFFAGEVADAYLRRTSIQRGLSVVVWRGRHVAEPSELSDEEAATYMREVFTVGRAIEQVMQPVKMNYNLLGNSLPHLHTHVVPRFADDPKPGWPFPFPEVEPEAFPEDELQRGVHALRAAFAT